MWKIKPGSLRENFFELKGRITPEELNLQSEACSCTKPLELYWQIEKEPNSLVVSGHLEGEIGVGCARCLQTYTLPVNIDVGYIFASEDKSFSSTVPIDGEIELDDNDLLIKPLTKEIDLLDLVRESLILEVPIQTLCREECQGLCSRCGINLNEEECDCEQVEEENPFAVIKKKLEDKKE
jgi:DUF177 domain-containing protein